MSKNSQPPTGVTGIKGVKVIPGVINYSYSSQTMVHTPKGWVSANSNSVQINMLDYSSRPVFEDDMLGSIIYVFMSWIYFILGRDYNHFHPNKYAFCYYKGNKLHRDDGPAFITRNNDTICWFKDGKLHREDGPAAFFRGAEYWYIEGRKITSQSEIDEIKFKAFFSKKKNLFAEENNV